MFGGLKVDWRHTAGIHLLILTGLFLPTNVRATCRDELQKLPQRSGLAEDLEAVREALQQKGQAKQEALQRYAAPKKTTDYDAAFVSANWLLLGAMVPHILQEFAVDPWAGVRSLLFSPVTLFAADFGSQVFHKWLDSYASEHHWFWGSTARAFRIHHDVPNNLDKTNYVTNVAPAATMLAPVFAATAVATNFGLLSPEAATNLSLFYFALMHTTEFHRQAHLVKPHPFFKALQTIGLSLSRKEHMAHHAPPFDKNFAVFLGWSNGMATYFDVWNRLDRLYWNAKGIMPHNWVQDPRSIPEYVQKILAEDDSKITEALQEYAATHPGRVPPLLKGPLEKAAEVRQRVRDNFIERRRALYREDAEIQDRAEAETRWLQEQTAYPWLYGKALTPLFPTAE